MSTARFRWVIPALGVALSGHATCQVAPRNSTQGTDELNGGHWFQLTLPKLEIPLKSSWLTTPSPTFEFAKFATYRWELSTLGEGPLSLHAFNQIQPAIELNCLPGVCEPMPERALGFEGRIHVGGSGPVPNNYFFIKRELILEPIRNLTRTRVGIGGLLDL